MVVFNNKVFQKMANILSRLVKTYKVNKERLLKLLDTIETNFDEITQDVQEFSSITLPNLLNPNIINSYLTDLIDQAQDPCENLIGQSKQMIKELVLEMVQFQFSRFPELCSIMKTTINNFIDQQEEKVILSMQENIDVEKSSPFTLL